MPATRIDEYRKDGFYGDMRAHHRKEAPRTYAPPLCWLPREVDNSAGGQVWVGTAGYGVAWLAPPEVSGDGVIPPEVTPPAVVGRLDAQVYLPITWRQTRPDPVVIPAD